MLFADNADPGQSQGLRYPFKDSMDTALSVDD